MKVRILICLIGCWLIFMGHTSGLRMMIPWTIGLFFGACFYKKSEESEFYYVYNPEKDKPKYKHFSYEAALKEAKRLHQAEPNYDFQILKIVKTLNCEIPQ